MLGDSRIYANVFILRVDCSIHSQFNAMESLFERNLELSIIMTNAISTTSMEN